MPRSQARNLLSKQWMVRNKDSIAPQGITYLKYRANVVTYVHQQLAGIYYKKIFVIVVKFTSVRLFLADFPQGILYHIRCMWKLLLQMVIWVRTFLWFSQRSSRLSLPWLLVQDLKSFYGQTFGKLYTSLDVKTCQCAVELETKKVNERLRTHFLIQHCKILNES